MKKIKLHLARTVKVVIAIALMISVFDAHFIELLYANSEAVLTVDKFDEEQQVQNIIVPEGINGAKIVELYNHENDLIAKQEIDQGLLLPVKYNDTYNIVVKDDKNNELSTSTITIEGFKDMQLKQSKPYTFLIETNQVNAVKANIYNSEDVKIASVALSDKKGKYEVTQIGKYSVELLDYNEHVLGNGRSSIEILAGDEKVVQEHSDARGIEITDEKTLFNIKDHNEYYLSSDLTLTKNVAGLTYLGNKTNVIIHGNGYSISNLQKPLFNQLTNSLVEDTYFQANIEVKGSGFGGSVANVLEKSTLAAVGVNSVLNADEADYVGGLVGYSDNSDIKNCFVSGSISGVKYIGGLVGKNKGRVDNSYASAGLVSQELVGGLVAHNSGVVENSYFSGSIQADLSDDIIAIEEGNNINNYASEKQSIALLDNNTVLLGDWNRSEKKYPQLSERITSIQKDGARVINEFSVSTVVSVSENKIIIDQSNSANIVRINGAKNTSGELELSSKIKNVSLQNADMQRNYFLAADSGEAPVAETISKGAASKDKTTTITLSTKANAYYLAVKSGNAAPQLPTNFDAAKAAGWVLKVGGAGLMTIPKLAWNCSYDVYEATSEVTLVGTVITNKGLLDGRVVLSDAPYTDIEVQATVENGNDIKGTWSYEIADSIQSSTWTNVGNVNTYTPTIAQRKKYLRATFTASADADHSGSIKSVVSSSTLIKTKLVSASISGAYMNGETLSVTTTPNASESVLSYAWYHEGSDKALGRKSTYVLGERDINHKVYVKVTSSNTGGYSGEVESNHSELVETKAYEKPSQTLLVSNILETSMSIQLSGSNNKGIFEIAYKKESDSEYADQTYKIINDGVVTVVGLEPATTYLYRVKQLGSNGFLDSQYNEFLTGFKTSMPSIKGELALSGEYISGATLTLNDDNVVGSGDINWYTLANDGTLKSVGTKNNKTYVIANEDIGSKIKVEYVGKDNCTGSLVTYSDIIPKIAQSAPTEKAVISNFKDTSVSVSLPNEVGKKYQIGYGTSEQSPLFLDSKIYDANETVSLSGLNRNTKYYLWIKYAANSTYYDSEWGDTSESFSTLETIVAGEITLSMQTPHLKEKLIASMSDDNLQQGVWKWYKKAPLDSDYSDINNFYPVDGDDYKTYYIPTSDELGTLYKVVFTGKNGYVGTKEFATVNGLAKELGTIAYETPLLENVIVSPKDTSFSVSIKDGIEGNYKFKYSVNNDISTATEVGRTYQAGGVLTLDKLGDGTLVNRNTNYYVWVKRVKDRDLTDDSNYSASKQITTLKTKIMGSLILSSGFESPRDATTISATYEKGQYIPAGNDLEGTWKWYQVKDDVTTLLSGNQTNGVDAVKGIATSTYTIQSSDIGKNLMAVYEFEASADKGFMGKVEATSQAVKGVLLANPSVPVLKAAPTGNTTNVVMNINLGTITDVYYQILKEGTSVPEQPASPSDALIKGWVKPSSATFDVSKLSDGTNIGIQQNYVVYAVRVADLKDTSDIVRSTSSKSGTMVQSGKIALTETIGGVVRVHVGRELTANISGENNLKGTWKWYYSNTDYTTDTPTAWTQINGGIYPISNSKNSTLSVPDIAKGKYLKAEFEPSSQFGYQGVISSGRSAKLVTKTFTESLEISGKPYSGETIKITLKNSDRKVANIEAEYEPYGLQISANDGGDFLNLRSVITSDNTFEATIPDMDTVQKSKDGYYVRGYVKVPDRNIYRNDDGSFVESNGWIFSSFDCRYVYGKTIKNAADLENFIKATGDYTDRASTYILSNDINMNNKDLSPNSTEFTGRLRGEYRTIYNMKSSIGPACLFNMTGIGSIVENFIVHGANVNVAWGNVGIIAQRSEGTIQNVMVTSSSITSPADSAAIVGSNHGTISRTAVVGSRIESTAPDTYSVGALAGSSWSQVTNDNMSVNSTVIKNQSKGDIKAAGSLIGSAHGTSNYNRNYVANIINGGILGGVVGGLFSGGKSTFSNNYFDKKLAPDPILEGPAAVDGSSIGTVVGGKGVGKNTNEMTGTAMSSAFSGAPAGTWTYINGYYPRLTWAKDNPLMKLFTVTPSAFTSLDWSTGTASLANNTIKGAVQLPSDLIGGEFKYSSSNSNIIQVSKNGILTPKAFGVANITISYTPNVSGAVASTNVLKITSEAAQKSFNSVDIQGGSALGNTLTAVVSPSTAGVTYQWFRRPASGGANEYVGNGTNTYRTTQDDAGYQIKVRAEMNEYAPLDSEWTAPIIGVTPTSGPSVTDITNNSVKVSGTGSNNPYFEFAYAKGGVSGEKIIVSEKALAISIANLEHNTTYSFFARIPKGATYPASNWSPATTINTKKTALVGAVTLTNEKRVDETINATIVDTNMQTGTWKWISTKNGVDTDISSFISTNTTYLSSYKIRTSDVGAIISVQYIGNGNYEGSSAFTKSETIMNSMQMAPNGAIGVSNVNDQGFDVKLASDGSTLVSGVKYQFGYVLATDKNPIEHITPVAGNVSINTLVTISGLARNRKYLIFVRKASVTGYDESAWSTVNTQASTLQSNVVGVVSKTDKDRVDQEISFNVDATNNQVGKWILERRDSSDTLIATLSGFSIDASTRKIDYMIQPEDAGYKLRATFVGVVDFKEKIFTETVIINKAVYPTPIIGAGNVKDIADYSVALIAPSDLGNYQFTYASDSAYTDAKVSGSVKAGGQVVISDLKRNSTYYVKAKRLGGAGVIGYEDSLDSLTYEFKTLKTPISGKVDIAYDKDVTSGLPLETTVTFKYISGTYSPNAVDNDGTWKLYLDSEEIESSLINYDLVSNSASYKVIDRDKGKRVTGEYSANASGDLEGVRTAMSDRVFKAKAVSPSIPLVKANAAVEGVGSSVNVSNAVIGQFYKAVLSTEDAPKVPSSGAEAASGWIKASAASLDVTMLQPNKAYRIYTFIQETPELYASLLIPSASVSTAKQILTRAVQWVSNTYLVLQPSEVKISHGDIAPSGDWSWYVSKDQVNWAYLGGDSGVVNGEFNHSTTIVPIQYIGFYVKAVFVGNAGYSGRKEIVSPQVYGGSPIKGSASIDEINPRVFGAVNATYSGSDEVNGSWTWYRGNEEIDGMLYNKYGVESTFFPDVDDIGKPIKAKYSAGGNPYVGNSISDISANVKKGEQAKPDAPAILELVGNQVHIDPPSNYFPEGNKPLILYGYQEGSSEIVWESGTVKALSRAMGIDNNWIKNLKPNTTYNLYSKYVATNVYEESSVSDVTVFTTDKIILDASLISVTYDKSGVDEMSVGTTMSVVFKGEGYDAGLWSVANAHSIVQSDREGTINTSENSNTFTYKFDASDMNSYITIIYTPKESATSYTGVVEVNSSGMVRKQANPGLVIKPVVFVGSGLSLELTTELGQEYMLSETSSAPDPEANAWKSYTNTKELFTGLKPGTDYYVHGRIKESESMSCSNSSVSDKATTVTNYQASEVTISNAKTESDKAFGKLEFAIPDTWHNQEIGISNIGMKDDSGNSATMLSDLSQFSAPAMHAKGSVWGNANFGYSIVAIDASDIEVAQYSESTHSIQLPDTARKLLVTLYRVNAVSNAHYAFSMDLLEYDVAIPAIGSVKMVTDLQATTPTEMPLHADSGKIFVERDKSITIQNLNLLPIGIDLRKQVNKDATLPTPLGALSKPAESIGNDDFYLKMSSDGSGIETNSGVYVDGVSSSVYENLLSLGKQKSNALNISGVYGSNIIFPIGVKQQAYQFTFKYYVNGADL